MYTEDFGHVDDVGCTNNESQRGWWWGIPNSQPEKGDQSTPTPPNSLCVCTSAHLSHPAETIVNVAIFVRHRVEGDETYAISWSYSVILSANWPVMNAANILRPVQNMRDWGFAVAVLCFYSFGHNSIGIADLRTSVSYWERVWVYGKRLVCIASAAAEDWSDLVIDPMRTPPRLKGVIVRYLSRRVYQTIHRHVSFWAYSSMKSSPWSSLSEMQLRG